MSVATDRLKVLGVPAFAGNDPATATRELQWFATTAWNAGHSSSSKRAKMGTRGVPPRDCQ
jgi:hypothetical protein